MGSISTWGHCGSNFRTFSANSMLLTQVFAHASPVVSTTSTSSLPCFPLFELYVISIGISTRTSSSSVVELNARSWGEQTWSLPIFSRVDHPHSAAIGHLRISATFCVDICPGYAAPDFQTHLNPLDACHSRAAAIHMPTPVRIGCKQRTAGTGFRGNYRQSSWVVVEILWSRDQHTAVCKSAKAQRNQRFSGSRCDYTYGTRIPYLV